MESLAAPATITKGSFERELDRLRSSLAYANYLRVRDEVFRMKSAAGAREAAPSAYWREELGGFEYMLDASPLIVSTLRHHTFHVTGLRVYEHRSGASKPAADLARKLEALRAFPGAEALLVPESPALGGFGHEIDGALYNIDTLKFFEALIALDRAEELDRVRRGTRPLVVEIGGGWGGFAYQFKTLFPHVRYVIVDLPELFLFSAVYLMTVFPDARCSFVSSREAAGEMDDDADFVFVSNGAFDRLPLDRIDLGINMVSFQEMATAQVRAYLDWLHRSRTRAVYSLNRDRSFYNDELTSVRELMAESFWLTELEVLPVAYNKPMRSKPDQPSRSTRADPATSDPFLYRHVIGRPKLRTWAANGVPSGREGRR
jgi:hypothetical protein